MAITLLVPYRSVSSMRIMTSCFHLEEQGRFLLGTVREKGEDFYLTTLWLDTIYKASVVQWKMWTWSIGGKITTGENGTTGSGMKRVSVPLCLPQIPNALGHIWIMK